MGGALILLVQHELLSFDCRLADEEPGSSKRGFFYVLDWIRSDNVSAFGARA